MELRATIPTHPSSWPSSAARGPAATPRTWSDVALDELARSSLEVRRSCWAGIASCPARATTTVETSRSAQLDDDAAEILERTYAADGLVGHRVYWIFGGRGLHRPQLLQRLPRGPLARTIGLIAVADAGLGRRHRQPAALRRAGQQEDQAAVGHRTGVSRRRRRGQCRPGRRGARHRAGHGGRLASRRRDRLDRGVGHRANCSPLLLAESEAPSRSSSSPNGIPAAAAAFG